MRYTEQSFKRMCKIKKEQKMKTEMKKSKKREENKGFTMVELLVVMAILGILSTIGLTSFRTSLMKSRDAKRKSDLEQIQRALEMYNNDYGKYPTSASGKITTTALLTWGFSEFSDAKGTIYMKELPGDPTGNPEYCYVYSAGPPVAYKIYAKLENTEDPRATLDITCNDVFHYNYGVSSSNTTP